MLYLSKHNEAVNHGRTFLRPTASAEVIAATLGKSKKASNGFTECLCPVCCKRKLGLKISPKGWLISKCWTGCAREHIEAVLLDRGLMKRVGGQRRTSPCFILSPPPPPSHEQRQRRLQLQIAWLEAAERDTIPLNGTPAETYLRDERRLAGVLPECAPIGYLADDGYGRPALAAFAKDDDGDTLAVLLIYLDGETPGKRSRGFLRHASVRLPSRSGGRRCIIVCEGLVTALSVWLAVGCAVETWAIAGTSFLQHVKPPADCERVVLFADNDDDAKDGGRANRRLYEEARRRLSQTTRCCVVRPAKAGWDANDFFKHLPPEQARAAIRAGLRRGLQGENRND